MKNNKSKKIVSIIVISLFIILLLAMFLLLKNHIFESFKLKSWEPITSFLRDHKYQSMVFIILTQTLITIALVIPTLPFQVIAGALLGPIYGFLYLIIGTIVGHQIAYFTIYLMGDSFLSEKQQLKLNKIEENKKIKKSNIIWITLTYLIPGMPYGLIAFLLIKEKVRYTHYTIITSLGSIIPTVVAVLIGDLIPHSDGNLLLAISILIVVVFIGYFCYKHYKSKKHISNNKSE